MEKEKPIRFPAWAIPVIALAIVACGLFIKFMLWLGKVICF